MKIESSKVNKIVLREVKGLDPVHIFLEDLGPRQGQITIKCYDESWTASWGGMGDRTIAEFFCSCDEHYLAKNLSNIDSSVTDLDKVAERARAHVLKLRREKDIDDLEARELFDSADSIEDPFNEGELMQKIYGDDWWCCLPTKPNPNYEYLCRIINAVRSALKSMEDKEEPADDGALRNNILKWFINGRVGTSSQAMAARIAGIEGRGKSHPCDPSDLNRCLLFLDAVPEARLHMDKLRTLSPTWDRLVERWKELESTFLEEVGLNWSHGDKASKTYALMEEIQDR
ncbi:hypothetical protein KAR91_37185 [Candidatus Pacearchaeota archaeon]|nr:hypothetical protein [Candidatus Pacearchaeota archaeon]